MRNKSHSNLPMLLITALTLCVCVAVGVKSWRMILTAPPRGGIDLAPLMKEQLRLALFGIVGFVLVGLLATDTNFIRPVNKRVRMEETKTHIVLAIAAFVFGAHALALVCVAARATGFADYPWWAYAPLLPAIVMTCAALGVKKHSRFGVGEFELTQYPVMAGMVLRGAAHIPFRPESDVRITVRYMHQYAVKSKTFVPMKTDCVWRETKILAPEITPDGACAVAINPGNEARQNAEWEIYEDHTSMRKRDFTGHWWNIVLETKTRKRKYKAVFNIPVVKARPVFVITRPAFNFSNRNQAE
ncbi:MAG: hypothetical protein FWG05_03880 [Kiritimatiellaeota bacterium]|nr:hypothetical protein [Kiritimatiellota bacterium]